MEKQREEEIKERIRDVFGDKFEHACISKLGLSDEISQKLIDWLKKPKAFLVLTGNPGTGKTFFCASVYSYLYGNIPSIRAYHEKTLLMRLRLATSQGWDYTSQLEEMIDDFLIIIDDICSSNHNEWREDILMHLTDYRYSKKMPTVFTSNLSKKDFYSTYNHRIGSRLFAKENLIIEMPNIDYRALGM